MRIGLRQVEKRPVDCSACPIYTSKRALEGSCWFPSCSKYVWLYFGVGAPWASIFCLFHSCIRGEGTWAEQAEYKIKGLLPSWGCFCLRLKNKATKNNRKSDKIWMLSNAASIIIWSSYHLTKYKGLWNLLIFFDFLRFKKYLQSCFKFKT